MLFYIIIITFVFIFLVIYLFKIKKEISCDKTSIIKTLLRQSARWSTAAEQDENPMIAILHANYGAGYLWALKDIATDNEIEETGKINILQFRDEIVKVQDEATLKMVKTCPNFAPKKSYLTEIAKEG